MSFVRIGAKTMWNAAEYLDRTNFKLPEGRGKLQSLTPEQVRDGFERLQSLQREENGWGVHRDQLAYAPEASVPGYELGEVFGAFANLDRTLNRHANPTSVSDQALAELRAGTLSKAKAERLHRSALTDAFRLADPFQERGLQDAARAELARTHGEASAEVTAKSMKPQMELADEHLRKTAALETLLRLHTQGKAPAGRELLLAAVTEFGRYARARDLRVVKDVIEGAAKAGDQELLATARSAVDRIVRLEHIPTAHLQLEGGAVKAGGIRAYVNPLTEKLAALGHSQDVYVPLNADVNLAKEGGEYVAGSEGEIIGPLGERVTFHLRKEEGPVAHPNGARRTFFYIVDDTYATPRHGVYINEETGDAFEDAAERHIALSALGNAAMSKVAAIRKLGGGNELTAAQVRAAEETLTPADVPQLIQYNDSHLATSYPNLQFNEAFKDAAPLGIIHNGNPAYQTWIPTQYVEQALKALGGKFEATLPPGEYPNLLELMATLMRVSTVSDGYLQRMLNEPSEQVRMMASLQEASAEGRLGAVRNGINLKSFDPSRIEGTSQAAAYSAKDLSGKAACKTALQKASGLPVDPDAPVLVFGNRIASQKGLGDLLHVRGHAPDGSPITPLDTVLKENPKLQLVLGGPVAEPELGQKLLDLQARWPNNVHVSLGYADNRKLMSGGDVFLMASREEPCGITQMEAQALGSAVLYTNIDGLKDTVVRWDPLTGTGTGFAAEPNDLDSLTNALRDSVRWASQSASSKAQLQRNALEHSKMFDAGRWAANHAALMREAVNLAERERGV